jgi:hypothetical protein
MTMLWHTFPTLNPGSRQTYPPVRKTNFTQINVSPDYDPRGDSPASTEVLVSELLPMIKRRAAKKIK